MIELTFSSQNEHFVQTLELSLVVSHNPGHNIWNIHWFDLSQVIQNLIECLTNVTNELPHDFPYNLRIYGRLKTLRLKNLEITKLGNISKISHLVGNVAKGPVFLP